MRNPLRMPEVIWRAVMASPTRRRVIVIAVVGALVAAGVFGSKVVKPSPEPTIAREIVTRVDNGYVGSSSCQECHPEAFKKWAGSHHAEAERLVVPDRDRAAFEPAREFHHGTQKSTVEWRDGKAIITGDGQAIRSETHGVARVIGEDPLRQFLIAFPDGRYQVQEASYEPRLNKWFNVYGNEDRQPGEWGHWTGRGMNWNSRCAACHNTRVQKNYDRATDTYHTTMAERTVSCEACHGPLMAHVEWQKKFGASGRSDATIPKLSSAQVSNMCASCHARRSDLTGDFVPGDEFDDHYELATVDASDLFFPDGQVRDENYEQSSWLGSKMQHAGLTCLNCHPRSLHMAKLRGNDLCLQCHNGGHPKAPTIHPSQHSHHADNSTGNACANCHMPQTLYMQCHSRHDHAFTIPDPLLTKEFGVPNACNRCHSTQSTDWAVNTVDAWYGQKMERPTRERARIIARARIAAPSSPTDLVRLLQSEKIPYWRAVAANLLNAWATHEVVTPALQHGLNDPSALVRSASIRSLAPLVQNETLSKAVESKLADPRRNVRVAAAWALRATLDMDSLAGADLQRSMAFNADQPTGQMQLGAFELARGKIADALPYFQTAVKWDPY
ncbi:MAG: hypothetical protein RLZZ282_545, partial [Verrucomicrobiota bacterium]